MRQILRLMLDDKRESLPTAKSVDHRFSPHHPRSCFRPSSIQSLSKIVATPMADSVHAVSTSSQRFVFDEAEFQNLCGQTTKAGLFGRVQRACPNERVLRVATPAIVEPADRSLQDNDQAFEIRIEIVRYSRGQIGFGHREQSTTRLSS
jgi:hypothetical protein